MLVEVLKDLFILIVIISQPIHKHLLTDDNAASRRGARLCPRRSTCPCRGVDSQSLGVLHLIFAEIVVAEVPFKRIAS